MQYVFGTGSLVLVPPGSNPTPVEVGTLQEVTLNIDQALKELRGAYSFPVAVGQTEGKIEGTAKSGNLNAGLIRSFLSGATTTAGASLRNAQNEPGTIPGTPYQVTVTNSAQFSVDQGVYNVTQQKPMTRVASAPTTGQYSVAAGVYTFAAADTTNVVWISYLYTSTSGNTTVFTNPLMGGGTEFVMYVMNQSQGKYSGWKLHAVRLGKLALPTKNTDFLISDLAFSAFADSSGNVMTAYTAE